MFRSWKMVDFFAYVSHILTFWKYLIVLGLQLPLNLSNRLMNSVKRKKFQLLQLQTPLLKVLSVTNSIISPDCLLAIQMLWLLWSNEFKSACRKSLCDVLGLAYYSKGNLADLINLRVWLTKLVLRG